MITKGAVPILILYFLGSSLQVMGQLYPNSRPVIQNNKETEKENDIDLLIEKARALANLGNYEAAIVAYQGILKKDPANRTVKTELGELALKTKNWAYAVLVFTDLTNSNQQDVKTRNLLMGIHHAFKEKTKELKFVYELVKSNPNDVELLEVLASLYKFHDMRKERVKVLERLAELAPSKSEYLLQLSETYNMMGEVRKEFVTYKKLIKLETNNIDILKRIARKYGEIGNYSAQIKYYEKIKSIDKDTLIWQNALIESYENALKIYDFRFNTKSALMECEKHKNVNEPAQDMEMICQALKKISTPYVEATTSYKNYDFFENTTSFNNMLKIDLVGPVKGSIISLQNNYLQTNLTDVNSSSENHIDNFQTTSHSIKSKVVWSQKFSEIDSKIEAGFNKPIGDYKVLKPKFITSAGFNYKYNQDLTLSANYKLDYLNYNPIIIGDEVSTNSFNLSLTYSVFDNFHFSNSYNHTYYSDNNRSNNILLELGYDVIKTFYKQKNLEAKPPIGFDDSGTLLSFGLQYYFMDYKYERIFYPTVNQEQLISGSLTFEKQLFQSFFFKSNAFREISNKKSHVWGYNLRLEFSLNWILNLFAEYEDSRSRYVYNDQTFINKENGVYFGLISRF